MNIHTVSVLVSLSLLPAAGAAAQSLGPVVVTATRTEVPADRVLANVEMIGAAELERLPAADLGDALRLRAGIEVARLGGPGQQTSLFLRGTESNHALVLVDGLRINPGTIGSAAVQNIAPELVERVEIVKGPRSTLYGSDAVGGVINVITRRGRDAGLRAQAGFGDYDSRSASLTGGFGSEARDLSFGFSWLDSAGFPTRTGDATDRGYEHLSLTAAASARLGAVELGLRGWHASGTSEYSDFFVTPVDQDFENSAFAASAAFAATGSWETRVTLGHAVDEIAQNQSPDFLRTRRWTLDWQNDLALSDRQQLTAGLLWQDEEADAESFGLPYDAATTTAQFYVQDQASFGRHRLLAAAAWTDHETFGGHATWNAEYGYEPWAGALVTLAAGTAFRAPDATDLYGFGGNPALEPEESQSYEIALRQRIGERQSLSLALFRNEIDELIQFVVIDFDTFEGENRNVERARIEGAEATWRYEGERWSARAGLTLQDPRDTLTGARLLRRAKENATLALSRRIGGHEFALDLLYAGDRRDFGFPQPVAMPAYWLANLSARIAVAPRFTILARAENLFDEDYELARGFNTMGRSLFVALRHDFR
ncbi:MAG: TonB-dependent receptor [Steroidobacteraceae bacterium]|nr:TonB-dependent receptor [Steroidobacteraceae bacterium]